MSEENRVNKLPPTVTQWPTTTQGEPRAGGKTPRGRRPGRGTRAVRAVRRHPLLVTGGVLALALGGWVVGESLSTPSSDSTAAPSSVQTTSAGPATPPVDPQSVAVATRSHQATLDAKPKQGCADWADRGACMAGWQYSPPTSPYVHRPTVVGKSGYVSGKGDGNETLTIIQHQGHEDSAPQRWGVLVRNRDHKVVGDYGIDHPEWSPQQVAQTIEEKF